MPGGAIRKTPEIQDRLSPKPGRKQIQEGQVQSLQRCTYIFSLLNRALSKETGMNRSVRINAKKRGWNGTYTHCCHELCHH
jgi:hypothetical protein